MILQVTVSSHSVLNVHGTFIGLVDVTPPFWVYFVCVDTNLFILWFGAKMGAHLRSRSGPWKCIIKLSSELQHIGGTRRVTLFILHLSCKRSSGQDGSWLGKMRLWTQKSWGCSREPRIRISLVPSLSMMKIAHTQIFHLGHLMVKTFLCLSSLFKKKR